jgi:hypothetical protein
MLSTTLSTVFNIHVCNELDVNSESPFTWNSLHNMQGQYQYRIKDKLDAYTEKHYNTAT